MPRTPHYRGVSLGSRRTHVITPNWSLASQCLQKVGGHSPPSYILLVRNREEERISVPLIPDETFLHMPCATFTSRQKGARVAGRLHYELPEGEAERFLNDPTFYCEPRTNDTAFRERPGAGPGSFPAAPRR